MRRQLRGVQSKELVTPQTVIAELARATAAHLFTDSQVLPHFFGAPLIERAVDRVVWVFMMGTPPLPDMTDVIIGLIGQALALGVNFWLVVGMSDASHVPPGCTPVSPLV